jgi:hypothetical protein
VSAVPHAVEIFRTADVYAERGEAFIQGALNAPPPPMLVAGVLPAHQIVAAFGPPRSRKSWVLQELAVSVATGTPALGHDTFRAGAAAPVLYVTNEDSPRSVAARTRALLAGRDIFRCPDILHFRVRKGSWLDALDEQERLLAEVQREGYALVVLDPIRSLTGCIDKGPSDLLPFGRFLRALVAETSATIALGHHTTKPPATPGPDARALPDRMSGGGLFSYIEAPLAIERIDEDKSQLTPTFWKHSPDPPAVLIRLETNDPQEPTVARLIGELAGSTDAKETALQARVLDFLHHSPAASTNKVAQGVRAHKTAVAGALEQLERAGRVDRMPGTRSGFQWFCSTGSTGSATGSAPVPDTGSLPIRENQSEPLEESL